MDDFFFRPLSTWLATTAVEAIEVLRLRPVDDLDAEDTKFLFGEHGLPRAGSHTRTLTIGERDRCVELVRALPAGNVARCHKPGFGLRVNAGPAEIKVTLCFECSNAYVDDDLMSFDAASPAAADLLEFLRSLEYAR